MKWALRIFERNKSKIVYRIEDNGNLKTYFGDSTHYKRLKTDAQESVSDKLDTLESHFSAKHCW